MLTLAWGLVFAFTLLNFFALCLRFLGYLWTIFILPTSVALLAWISTEALSALDSLEQRTVAFLWLALLLLTYALALLTGSYRHVKQLSNQALRIWAGIGLLYKAALSTVFGIWGITFGLAIYSPPNNWDSMTYHMPRVMHWITNQSVEPYFTAIDRQIVQPPLSSFLILQTVVTTNNDYLANLINWCAGIWCLVVIGALAHMLTRKREITTLSVFFAGTVPIGIAESTTTQNEWLMTLWPLLMCLLWIGYQKRIVVNYQAMGLAAGFLLFASATTKQQSLLYSLIFFLALVASVARNRDFSGAAALLSLGGLGALVALSPQLLRNLATFDSVWGPPDLVEVVAGRSFFDPLGQAKSILGHALFNLPIPKLIPVEQLGDQVLGLFGSSTAQFFAASGWSQYLPFPGLQLHEDSAANPVSFFFGTAALLAMLVRGKDLTFRYYSAVSLALGLSILLLWEAYIGSNRYFLTYFALASLPLGYYVFQLRTRFKWFVIGVVATWSLLFVLFMEYRPILTSRSIINAPREDLYIYARENLQPQFTAYQKALDQVAEGKGKEVVHVGVLLGGDDYEYPLWKASKGTDVRIHHIGPNALNSSLHTPRYDLVFCWNPPSDLTLRYGSRQIALVNC